VKKIKREGGGEKEKGEGGGGCRLLIYLPISLRFSVVTKRGRGRGLRGKTMEGGKEERRGKGGVSSSRPQLFSMSFPPSARA